MAGRELSKTLGLIGCGFGVIMFLLYGLSRGALIGGTAGLQLGCYLSGEAAAGAGLLPRLLAGIGMVTGAALTGVIFVTSGMAAGRLVGYAFGEDAAVKKGVEAPRAVH